MYPSFKPCIYEELEVRRGKPWFKFKKVLKRLKSRMKLIFWALLLINENHLKITWSYKFFSRKIFSKMGLLYMYEMFGPLIYTVVCVCVCVCVCVWVSGVNLVKEREQTRSRGSKWKVGNLHTNINNCIKCVFLRIKLIAGVSWALWRVRGTAELCLGHQSVSDWTEVS